MNRGNSEKFIVDPNDHLQSTEFLSAQKVELELFKKYFLNHLNQPLPIHSILQK